MASEPLLEVTDLKISLLHGRPAAPVVGSVSFTLERGSVLGLIGESGCGKSLTCLAIVNLLPRGVVREAGEIRLEGERIDCISDGRWRELRGKRMAVILRKICDQVAVLHQGRIVERCFETSGLDQLSHPATRALLSSVLPAFPR